MKYKSINGGRIVACDGSRHHYEPCGNQPVSALCWCHQMTKKQLARWADTTEKAHEIAALVPVEAA